MVGLNPNNQTVTQEDISSVLKYIEKLVSDIEFLDKQRIEARNRLNEEWAIGNHAYWGGVKLVREIVGRTHQIGEEKTKRGGSLFLIKELKANKANIIRVDPPLWANIERSVRFDEDELLILNELLERLKKGKAENILDYLMREHRGEGGREPLPERLARFKDRKLAEDIYSILRNARLLEDKLRGRIGFLHDFLNRLDSLGKEAGSLNNYIEEFRRLIYNLRRADPKSKLADKIEASNIIKQLLNYHDEINKLEEYLGLVERGMKERRWEEFLDVFYPKLDAEEGIIRDQFGDIQAANAMEHTRKRYSKYPVEWQRLFQELLARKRSEAHIRGLMDLCYRIINRLIDEEIARIEGVVHYQLTVQLMKIEGRIKARIKEFRNVKANVKSILKNREKTLMRFLKATKKEFEKKEENVSIIFEENREVLANIPKMRIDSHCEALRKSEGYRTASLPRLAQNLRGVRQSVGGIIRNPKNSYNFASIFAVLRLIHYLLHLEEVEGQHANRLKGLIYEEIPVNVKTSLSVLLRIKESLKDSLSYLRLQGFIEKANQKIIREGVETTRLKRGDRHRLAA